MTVKLLTKPGLRFLSLKGCCTGSSESTLCQNTTVLVIMCHGSYTKAKNIKRMSEYIIVPAHEILVLTADSNRKGSDEPEHVSSLIRTLAAHV